MYSSINIYEGTKKMSDILQWKQIGQKKAPVQLGEAMGGFRIKLFTRKCFLFHSQTHKESHMIRKFRNGKTVNIA